MLKTYYVFLMTKTKIPKICSTISFNFQPDKYYINMNKIAKLIFQTSQMSQKKKTTDFYFTEILMI